jgi:hypothetical protein
MFIRIFRPREDREILVNVDHISKIEVKYAVPRGQGKYDQILVEDGLEDPEAVRWYCASVAGEIFQFPADPSDPVMKVFDDIYKNAVKG